MEVSECNLCGTTGAHPVFVKHGWRLVRCDQCTLLRVDPQPTPAQVFNLYSPESGYQQFQCGDGENRYAAWAARRARKLASLVGPAPKHATLLDVGCATGTFLAIARSLGWRVRGLELGAHLAEHGRKTHGLDIEIGDVQDAASRFEETSFDLITMWDVVEHLARPRDAVATLMTLLKPGGTLYASTPNEDGWVSRFHWRALRPLTGAWPHPEPPRHLYQFSRPTMAALYRAVGLTAIRHRHDEIPLWYSSGFEGVPGARQGLMGQRGARLPRFTYVISAPAFVAARVARRGDSMILRGRRPSVI
jgi:SAM-dependent methyltransferase